MLYSLEQLFIAQHIVFPVLECLEAPNLSSLQIYWTGTTYTIPPSPVPLHRFPSLHALSLEGTFDTAKDK
ncbi:hypothetical protein DL93DRAFT_2089175 [Clavulina sp. PMI_390]|nr:hypothetical protein DL93DRAFT_2089175 [Clavulina sp. PMI_390]